MFFSASNIGGLVLPLPGYVVRTQLKFVQDIREGL